MRVCAMPGCQTSAGCKCDQPVVQMPQTIPMRMPQTYFTEQATMQLRWNNGVLEQAFIRTASMGAGEMVWRAIPSIGANG